ncbi:MAG: NAD-dependent protein deacetylase [Gammaproteobacteria bacterium]|nr:NAD-dependent protein deacetylase [Gammaproteobacteria bacterium]
MNLSSGISLLADFLHDHPRLFVLTGAGISTASGIPDYRDADGAWKRPAPVQYRDFVTRHAVRQRYWARSLVGWPWFQQAQPNRCHVALADWERHGRIGQLVTQNVDRLHQRAGSQRVVDLHGRLDRVICLDCGTAITRQRVQDWLVAHNPAFVDRAAAIAPDGDAALEDEDVGALAVPSCRSCGGTLKPDVVFFGEAIPRRRVEQTLGTLRAADALLVIGSSLMVYSGFRYCRIADEIGLPLVAINPGRTRADELFRFKLSERFETVIDGLAEVGLNPPLPADPA